MFQALLTDESQRKCGRPFGDIDDDSGLHVGDERRAKQFFSQEPVIGMHVGRGDPDDIVNRSGYGHAFHHLGPAGNQLLEGRQIVLAGQGQFNVGDDFKPKAQRASVKQCHPVQDQAIFFQSFDAPPAGGRGQAHALGDFCH